LTCSTLFRIAVSQVPAKHNVALLSKSVQEVHQWSRLKLRPHGRPSVSYVRRSPSFCPGLLIIISWYICKIVDDFQMNYLVQTSFHRNIQAYLDGHLMSCRLDTGSCRDTKSWAKTVLCCDLQRPDIGKANY